MDRTLIKNLLPFAIFALTAQTSGAAILHYGDKEFVLDTVKQTSPSMVFFSDGQKYYAPLYETKLPGRMTVNYNGRNYSVSRWVLWYEQTNFNQCASITLPAGIYRAEVRGGNGGDGGSGIGAGPGLGAAVKSQVFTLSSETSVSIFRGANGNHGANGTSRDNAMSGGGGGASGVPSIVVAGDTIVKSEGGAGGRGGSARDYLNIVRNTSGGGGGSFDGTNSTGLGAETNYSISTLGDSLYMLGAGGGGAPLGPGQPENVKFSYGGGASGAGSVNSGGGGGSAWRMASKSSGGAGGTSVNWTCGGQTLYSYGGGGAGALQTKGTSQFNVDGAPGGSGTTGTSTTSYARIYKID